MDDEVARPAEAVPDPVDGGAQELRRLIDAGAGSPEELRVLAERIRAQRAMEDERWRQEVRPALLQSKKRKLSARDLRDRPDGRSSLAVGLALLAGVLVLLLAATQGSFLWILLPVAGVLVYAWGQGRRAATGPPSVDDDPPGGGVDTLGP